MVPCYLCRMSQQPTPLPIQVISAGAGSGKTYSLTERMVDMLEKNIRPSAILATTFTKKAAAELQERVRSRLMEAGNSTAANELGNALIGTVHSIGVKLLQRFAFDAGVSPLVEVIADGDEQRLFNESLSQILSSERTDRMNTLSERLGLTKKGFGKSSFDWRASIRQLTDVARANNFSSAVLEESKHRSWESFAALLPPASEVEQLVWNNRLNASLQQTVAALEANEADTTLATKAAVELLRQMENQLKWNGSLAWHEWVKIAKIAPGAKSRELMEDLKELALRHEEQKAFHSDIKSYIDLVFEISIEALQEYEQYKQKRGLIDYTDMETYVSRLLRMPSVRETLREELDLLLVDEFQDTSPIQLDIFLQLSQLAKHSIWVGDPKQSIYGFRGAEPALMKAIIEATGGIRSENILKESWRSRADLVEASNAIFTRAFQDLPAEQVVLTPNFSTEKEVFFWKKMGYTALDTPLALRHWHFLNEENNKKVPGQPWLEDCIASQIAVFLRQEVPVFDKSRKTTRPVRPGDIAILCRNNSHCQQVAEALHRAGLKAGVARSGLLETAEVRLALAYLRRLVNPNDRLSAAEIKLISGDLRLKELIHQLWEASPEQKRQLLDIPMPGNDLHSRSAAEALDLLLSETDLRRTVCQLGQAVQRLDNLEVLRRYAREYESACNRLHTAATIGGFLLWLNRQAELSRDYQGSGESEDTIHVLTYHKSKGLEYPVCICHNLDQSLKENVWEVNLMPEGPPDLNDILGGRWLRYWVNPYADQLRNTRLEERLRQSTAFTEATRQALEEEARLLYVGITRARDYLIFPTTANGTRWLNRVFSHGDENATTLDPDSDETPFYTVGGRVLQCQTERLFFPKIHAAVEWKEAAYLYHAESAGKHYFSPEKINPAAEAVPTNPHLKSGAPLLAAPMVTLDPALTADQAAAIKSLMHRLHPDLPLAEHQLKVRQLVGKWTADALLKQAVTLLEWLRTTCAAVGVQTGVPVRCVYNERIFEGIIDVLLESTDQTIHLVLLAEKESAATLAWLGYAVQRQFPGRAIRLWALDVVEGQAREWVA
jgi:ATP-dependent helicase/nuclease subunit A